MSELSLNAQPQVEDNVEIHDPDVYLINVDMYKDIVQKFKVKMEDLIKSGHVSTGVAERITEEFMYQNFQSMVKISYN